MDAMTPALLILGVFGVLCLYMEQRGRRKHQREMAGIAVALEIQALNRQAVTEDGPNSPGEAPTPSDQAVLRISREGGPDLLIPDPDPTRCLGPGVTLLEYRHEEVPDNVQGAKPLEAHLVSEPRAGTEPRRIKVSRVGVPDLLIPDPDPTRNIGPGVVNLGDPIWMRHPAKEVALDHSQPINPPINRVQPVLRISRADAPDLLIPDPDPTPNFGPGVVDLDEWESSDTRHRPLDR